MNNPFAAISIIFALGISLAAVFQGVSLGMFTAVSVLGLMAGVLFFYRSNKKYSGWVLFLIIFISGTVRHMSYNYVPDNSIFNMVKGLEGPVYYTGRVQNDPVYKNTFRYVPEYEFVLGLEAINSGEEWTRCSGKALVKREASGRINIGRGDKVCLLGKIRRPKSRHTDSRFDYMDYLCGKRIYAVIKSGANMPLYTVKKNRNPLIWVQRYLYRLKLTASRTIRIYLPPPHYGILSAMLLGDRTGLDPEAKNIFIRTGSLHILAISGLHVGIIIFLIISILRVFGMPTKPAYVATVILILFYALTIGDRASVWRAVLMASLFLLGYVINRRAEIANIYGATLFVLLMINPNYIQDVGFILSFTCVAAIIWVYPVFKRALGIESKGVNPEKIPRLKKMFINLMKTFVLSSSIWISAAPLIAYFFGIITPITILANLIVVPVCFVLVFLGITALFLDLLIPILSAFIFETIVLCDRILLGILDLLMRLPFAYIEIRTFSIVYVVGYYFFFILLLIFIKRIYSVAMKLNFVGS